MIKIKIDKTLGKTVSSAEREALAHLIYYPYKEIKKLGRQGKLTDEWRKLTIYRLILVCEAVSAKYTRSRVRKRTPKDLVYILDELLNVTDDVVKEYYYDEIISTSMVFTEGTDMPLVETVIIARPTRNASLYA